MGIFTLDGVLAGMQPPQDVLKVGAATVAGRFYSPWYVAGRPGAAAAASSGLSGSALTTYTGQIPFSNPVSGSTYLARLSASCNVAGTLFLCDRLWHNSGIVVTTASTQTINSVAFPPRDSNGTINGENVMIGAEVSTVMGAGTPTWTMTYTNSQGVSGKTITTAAQTATMAVGSFIPIQLGTGDTGVQSVQTWTQSATMTSGAYSLVAYRVLARLDIPTGNIGNAIDAITSGFPKLYDNTVPFFLWLPATVTAPTITAQVIYTQG